MSYYDYLDKWKRVIVMLSKHAAKHWNEHEDAFACYGIAVKRDVYIESKASSNIQMIISNRKLFSKGLFKRQDFWIYLADILIKLKPEQKLVMHCFVDNTDYLEMNFYENNESTGILLFECQDHKPKSRIINNSQISDLIEYLEHNINLYIASIKRDSKGWIIKLLLSQIIRTDSFVEKELIKEDSDFNTLYSKKNCICCPNAIVCEYRCLANVNKFWNSFCFKDSVQRAIFVIKQSLSPRDLDDCLPLFNSSLTSIEIKDKSFKNKGNLRDKKSSLCVYLRKKQFIIRTSRSYYLVEPISSFIAIVGDFKQHKFKHNCIFLRLDYIIGEHFKVKLNLDDYCDYNRYLKGKYVPVRYAIVKISDIFKIELDNLDFTRIFYKYPNLERFEIHVRESNKRKFAINRLRLLPRSLKVCINIYYYSKWILYDCDFWKRITEFKYFYFCGEYFENLSNDELKIIKSNIFKKICMPPLGDAKLRLKLEKAMMH